jgi:hypothetical protein
MFHPGQTPMPILNCIHNLTHSNLQRGEDIRQTPISALSARGLYHQQAAFKTLKRKQPGRNHLSVPVIVSNSGRDCRYDKCPGYTTNKKRSRAYTSKYKCEQCSIDKGIDFWLCHTTKKIDGEEVVVELSLSEMISVLKYVYNNYELFY